MRPIDADALKAEFAKFEDNKGYLHCDYEEVIDNAPTVEITDYDTGYQDGLEDGLNDIRPQGEWIVTGEEQGALGITYKIRKCDKCGWEHSLIIPDKFCPNCGCEMFWGKE